MKAANADYETQINNADDTSRSVKKDAADKRLEVLKARLKAFTQDGDFDRALACKAVIEQLEAAVEDDQ